MLQIWATEQEIADMLHVAPTEAARLARAAGLATRRSHDGLIRVKLPAQLAIAAVLEMPEVRKAIDAASADRAALIVRVGQLEDELSAARADLATFRDVATGMMVEGLRTIAASAPVKTIEGAVGGAGAAA